MSRALALAGLCAALVTSDAHAARITDSICGWREAPTFAIWKFLAEHAAPRVAPSYAVPVEFHTADNVTLHGYRIAASIANPPRAAILFIQGNSTTAAAAAEDLRALAVLGFDVFVLDFRGYAKSEGIPRIGALITDYRALIAHLRKIGFDRVFLYGCSLGGVIALNSIDSSVDGLVIDSSPATATSFGCPVSLNPIGHIPADCRRWMIMTGGRDRVVLPKDSGPLVDRFRLCGARIIQNPTWPHVFMGTPAQDQQRLTLGGTFLKQLLAGDH